MSDMLVKLYDLPKADKLYSNLETQGITLRNAIVPEKSFVCNWVLAHFSMNWRDECEAAFSRQPVSCIIAIFENELVGFACYNVTSKGFFGPTGVNENYRGKSIGKALLFRALEGLKNDGFAYGIIGGVGPVSFYEKAVNAILIPDSTPGVYKGLLKKNSP